MKRCVIYIWVCLLCLAVGCRDEAAVESVSGSVGSEESFVTLRFGHEAPNHVNITTRATLGVVPESRVQNLFVYLCVGEKCIYTHYFDKENLMASESEVASAEWNCWYVDNLGVGENPAVNADATNGVIRMRTADVENATLYLVANIDADMVNISPEKLNTIRTREEIEHLTATLNQEITSRNGYFPMGGVVRNVSIKNNTVVVENKQVVAELVRLDAKVQVNVRTAIGNVNAETEGEGDGAVTTLQTLTGFIPESWRVVNIPKGAYVMPYVEGESSREDKDYDEIGYFDTEEVVFEETKEENVTFVNSNTGKSETVSQKTHSFSFYMLENKESANRGGNVGSYHLRDCRTKDLITGKYINGGNDNGIWDNAPEQGTYLEIRGQVEMEVDVSTSAKQQHLAANVLYYIHLGDFATSVNDYDVLRNTAYTYTITIKGVNSIEVEVKTSQGKEPDLVDERESGATGEVYVAEEEIYTFDAHYGQRVYMIDAASIDPENVTWYVNTPFSEGMPEIVGGTEVPAGKDYKWVQFMVNQWADNGQTKYTKNNQTYPGYKGNTNQEVRSDSLKDVVEFTKYIKEEVRDLRAGKNSDFRKEFDEDWYNWYLKMEGKTDDEISEELKNDQTQIWWRDRMYVTIFVDEYYYEEDPITGSTREGLWKEFVNQPNRLMHILCDSQKSLDEASSSTGSIVTIRQRSIQTPYNINKEGLVDAWGCETEDETSGNGWGFYESGYSSNTDQGNYPTNNGLYNTACLWNLFKLLGDNGKKVADSYKDSVRWDEFLNYGVPNNHADFFLINSKKSMRHAALMRNRDNNGNEVIDPEEVRWYIASLEQLYGLYIGGLGVNSDAQLYSAEIAASSDWRRHIVCSNQTTITNSNQYKNKYWPELLWAEEGVSISGYGQEWAKTAPNSIRCVRNLGMPAPTTETIIQKEQNIPTPLISVDSPKPGEVVTPETVYEFNLSNVNEKSLRFYTTRELEADDEHSETSRTYYGFRTSGAFVETTYEYSDLKDMLDRGEAPGGLEGYRVPNVREAALMSMYCPKEWWNDNTIISCSYYSHGSNGDGKDGGTTTWQFSNKYVTVNDDSGKLRLVQDYMPTE